jgi:hypothetical protein
MLLPHRSIALGAWQPCALLIDRCTAPTGGFLQKNANNNNYLIGQNALEFDFSAGQPPEFTCPRHPKSVSVTP